MSTRTTWVPFSTAGACGIKLMLANTSATGNFASLRIRARSDVAVPTWNQCTIAADLSASANIANFGELYGLTAFAQDNGYNQARGTHFSVGIKACIQCTGTSAGARYALILQDDSTTKATNNHYMIFIERAPTAVAMDGVFLISRPNLFDYFGVFNDVGGFVSDSDTSQVAIKGSLKVKTPAGDRYINLMASS